MIALYHLPLYSLALEFRPTLIISPTFRSARRATFSPRKSTTIPPLYSLSLFSSRTMVCFCLSPHHVAMVSAGKILSNFPS